MKMYTFADMKLFKSWGGAEKYEEKKKFLSRYSHAIVPFCLFAASRSAAGLLEWNSPSQALEALAACNHYVIRDPGTVFSCLLSLCS